MSMISAIRESAREFKKLPSLTGAALMSALHMILGYCKIVISTVFEIRFAFLALGVAGMLYGPVVAGVVGAIGDILVFIIRPNGFFFPGFTFNEFVYGFVFGLFFYKKRVTVKRIIAAKLTLSVLINIILTPIWLNMMYGSELFAIPRLIKAVVSFPAECVILYFIMTTAQKVRDGQKNR
ncbi:MAG: folate family ECF transporter S component [Lachnospiraceae bacterium]|nr:folate family ECF transporter S component [Lachnospiraceae bacterium]